MNYIFFHTVIGNEKLLLKWLSFHYPSWHLSYSAPGWVTVKASNLEELVSLQCPLALRWGRGLKIIQEKLDLTHLQKLVNLHKVNHLHYFEKEDEESNFIIPSIANVAVNQPLKENSRCLHIYKIKNNLYATGLTLNNRHQSPCVGGRSIVEAPKTSPSRAYLKLAQLHAYYNFNWKKNDLVLELGASPGGITCFLLEQDLRVHALDSAPLKIEHSNLESMVESVQRLRIEEISSEVNWLVSDLNLSPRQTLQEMIRIGKNLKLKGMMITIKLPKLEMAAQLEKYLRMMSKEFPRLQFSYFQVPSHKQETHLIGTTPLRNRPA